MLNKIFDQTLKYYGIQGKALSELTGITQNHISEFRRGKSDVSSSILWRLILGMDELAPGSKRYFCDLMMGKSRPALGQELEFLIEAADISELEAAMLQIVRRMFPSDKNHKEEEQERLKSSVPW